MGASQRILKNDLYIHEYLQKPPNAQCWNKLESLSSFLLNDFSRLDQHNIRTRQTNDFLA
jgi:hypothetical protein